MAISVNIPSVEIASKIYSKLSLKEEKEQTRHLYSSTWKLHYNIVRLSCLICEFEDRINSLIEQKLDKDEFKTALDFVFLFLPLENIDELPYDRYSMRLNFQTLPFRQHIWMLNQISSRLKEEQDDSNLLAEFVMLIHFLNVDSLMGLLRGIHEYTLKTTTMIYKAESQKNRKSEAETTTLIESIMKDARDWIGNARNQRRKYNDIRTGVDKYLNSLNIDCTC